MTGERKIPSPEDILGTQKRSIPSPEDILGTQPSSPDIQKKSPVSTGQSPSFSPENFSGSQPVVSPSSLEGQTQKSDEPQNKWGIPLKTKSIPEEQAQERENVIKDLRDKVNSDHKDWKSSQLLGKSLAEDGKYEEADQLFYNVLKNQPDRPEALNGLAYTLARRGDLAGAKAMYKEAFDASMRHPTEIYADVDALHQVANIQHLMGDDAGANKTMEQYASVKKRKDDLEYLKGLGKDAEDVAKGKGVYGLFNPLGAMNSAVESGTQTAVEGAKTIADTKHKFIENMVGEHPIIEGTAAAATNIAKGVGSILMGGVMATQPEAIAYGAAAQTMPEEAQKAMFQPISSIVEGSGYNKKDQGDFFNSLVSLADIAVSGKVLSAIHGAVSSAPDNVKSAIEKQGNGEVVTPEEKKAVLNYLNDNVDWKDIEDTKKKVVDGISVLNKHNDKIPDKIVDINKRADIANLIEQKEALEKLAEGKAPETVKDEQEQIKNIGLKIEEMSNKPEAARDDAAAKTTTDNKTTDENNQEAQAGKEADKEGVLKDGGSEDKAPAFKKSPAPSELSGENLTEEKAKELGFKNVHEAFNSAKKRVEGSEVFEKAEDMPREFVEEAAKHRKENPERTTGISHAAMRKTAEELDIKAPERGVGSTPEQEIARGRELLSKGVDPVSVIEDFNKDRKISAEAMSVIRAQEEQLKKNVYKAVDEFGENSDQDKEARKALEKWQHDIKPMATEWSKIGVGMQGETNIDTGSFVGLRMAFEEAHEKEFTPAQEKVAKEIAGQVKNLSEEVEGLKKKLEEVLNATEIEKDVKIKPVKPSLSPDKLARKQELAKEFRGRFNDITTIATALADKNFREYAGLVLEEAKGDFESFVKELVENVGEKIREHLPSLFQDLSKEIKDREAEEIRTRFVDKKDSDFSLKDTKDIWEYAKENYVKNDNYDFDDMIHGVASDLGLTSKQVYQALAKPKSARMITDQMYETMNKQRRAVNAAKNWVKSEGNPKFLRFINALPSNVFGWTVLGHGTVGHVTHAGMYIFRPKTWERYWPSFFDQFKNAFGSTAEYEKRVAMHVRDSEYVFWKRNGLAIEPDKAYSDYEMFGKYFGRIGVAGDRGFFTLKSFRLDEAKHRWNSLPESAKADPEMARTLAKLVNHSTGASLIRTSKLASTVFFAPKLEASRWSRIIVDPATAIVNFGKMAAGKATLAEIASAKMVARNAGEIIATMSAMLGANQALLSVTGSDQNVNFTDPTKSDWLKYKAGKKTLDATGGVLSTIRFVTHLAEATFGEQKIYAGQPKDRKKMIYDLLGDYGRGKLAPLSQLGAEVAFHTDFMGNVLPFSSDVPAKGKEKLSWKEYGSQKLPIPFAGGLKDVMETMKDRGMSDVDIQDVLSGLITFGVEGGTGARLGKEPTAKKPFSILNSKPRD